VTRKCILTIKQKTAIEEFSPMRPNNWATPQGLDLKSKMEAVPKMARQRDSDAGQSKRR